MVWRIVASVLLLVLAACASDPPVKNASSWLETHYDKDGKKVKEILNRDAYSEYVTASVEARKASNVKLVEMDCRGVVDCFKGKLEVYAPPAAAAAATVALQPPPGPPESNGWKIYRELKEMVVGSLGEVKQIAGIYYPWKFGSQLVGNLAAGNKTPQTVVIEGSEGAVVNFGPGNASAVVNRGRINSDDTTTRTTNIDRSDRRVFGITCNMAPGGNATSNAATSPANGGPSGTINCPLDISP